MATVLITGGTGMVGTALTKELLQRGYSVIILTRKKKAPAHGVTYAQWNIKEGTIDRSAIEQTDHIVHLAGANVADGRWTAKRKQEIVDSRVLSGNLLVKALGEIPNKVQTVVSASAIGWYGADPRIPNHTPFVEGDSADNSFLGTTCQQWERAIRPMASLDKRLIIYRIGIVLSNDGGAFAEFKKPLRFGIASILGSGKQVVSWIHIDDLVELLLYAIENRRMVGTYNAVAPRPVSNEKLIRTIAEDKGGFYVPTPVPNFALKTMLGEMSIEVLKSATVSSEKLETLGYKFKFPQIEKAVENLNKKAS
ncbi:MAG TPA: TIGR01777 family oxidoreductase [Flavisolibacter sp.]|jgi:uncharacterized protein (TIGR01777 family)|nr:TIGR01777 family oxidoreductase [Flavisolibacter sp.]